MPVFYRFQDSGLDDFDKSNNYMQMGFRPGFAVQARELTQMQTIMQAQMTALARRFLKSGSMLDAELYLTPPGGGTVGDWQAQITSGYFYIEPYEKDLGYFVYNPDTLNLTNIDAPSNGKVNVYIQWEENQVNPDGDEYLAQNGYAAVKVNETLKDNAQGYANFSAPGASRYQINIVRIGWFIEDGSVSLPANSSVLFYIENGIPKYSDTNEIITY